MPRGCGRLEDSAMVYLGFIGSLGGPEIFVILIIVLLLFGGRKIPELAKGLGEGIKNFRSSMSGDDKDKKKDEKSPDNSEK
jgi:sec-independent protein translocase protein TatA